MDFLRRLLGREPSSREVAKERLQFVLIYDRTGLSPGVLDTLREEIVAVLSRHIDIDRDGIDLSVTQEGRQTKLIANIPLRSRRP
ncbi:MAG: cell division topological specificity factor MinE [Ardenticatenia bacterium]|nr:cell division topological specificity factor MinE [Ardenticatenia bacterium]